MSAPGCSRQMEWFVLSTVSGDGILHSGRKPCVRPRITESTNSRFGWSVKRCLNIGTSMGETILKISGYCFRAYAAQGLSERGRGLGRGRSVKLELMALGYPCDDPQFHSRPRRNRLVALLTAVWSVRLPLTWRTTSLLRYVACVSCGLVMLLCDLTGGGGGCPLQLSSVVQTVG